MSVVARAAAYAALFIGFVLVFVPARLLSWSGISRPATTGPAQVVAMVLGAAGAALALWCIASFAFVGKGTPAPFDPPRRLVVAGPYRVVRNPMYLGAALAVDAIHPRADDQAEEEVGKKGRRRRDAQAHRRVRELIHEQRHRPLRERAAEVRDRLAGPELLEVRAHRPTCGL